VQYIPTDHRMGAVGAGEMSPIWVSPFWPFTHTSKSPFVGWCLMWVTTRIQVPCMPVILAITPRTPPEPPTRISSFSTNISTQGEPKVSPRAHC
jgi:hypothetical protein